MLPKEDRAAMMLRLFNDTSPVINRTLKDSAKLEAEAAASDTKQEVQEEAPGAEMENAIPAQDTENAPTPENEDEAVPEPLSEAPEVPT
ncbi:hypothetical protein RRF57_010169 [Xylaria bambusicola]|uniref:Uncharacterized protein n=1 Tax=Xylaria bambusicola TaxID=326684 RepID=A0AAN7UWU6_9PEZI